ncbi:MAG TPA: DUF4212 domain-containing protein [Gammaproteobacteria bacterium]|nr:DUF4212 domain-containing protein [Gammaproteobacteria bacterium]
MNNKKQERFEEYWRANKRLIGGLLAIWALVSLGGGILFVELLNKVNFFGLPLGFWIAQQGAIYVFVILIFVYAFRMDTLDKKYRLDEDDEE